MQDSVRGINFQIDFFLMLSFFLLFRGDPLEKSQDFLSSY